MVNDMDITISDKEPNPKYLNKYVYTRYKRLGFVGFDYTKRDPIIFKTNPLPEKALKERKKLMIYIGHILNTYETLFTDDYSHLDDWIKDEVIQWEKEGIICVFMSVLLYNLLVDEGIFNRHELNLVQGFYIHGSKGSRADTLFDSLGVGGLWENHAGLHAFLSARGSVIDTTINQERDFFDFGDKPFVVSDIPEGLTLGGQIEDTKTIRKYTKMFARFSGMEVDEWIKEHKRFARLQYDDWVDEEVKTKINLIEKDEKYNV
jgi:hypothetical protein